MTDLWTEATYDHDAERSNGLLAVARANAAEVWPVLAAATSKADYFNRKAIHAERLFEAAGKDQATFEALSASLDQDFKVHHTARRREAALRQRIEAEAARRKTAAGLDNLGDAKADPFTGKDPSDETVKADLTPKKDAALDGLPEPGAGGLAIATRKLAEETHPADTPEGGDHIGPKNECPLCTQDGGKADPQHEIGDFYTEGRRHPFGAEAGRKVASSGEDRGYRWEESYLGDGDHALDVTAPDGSLAYRTYLPYSGVGESYAKTIINGLVAGDSKDAITTRLLSQGVKTAADAVPEGCIGCIVINGTPVVVKVGCPVHDIDAKEGAKTAYNDGISESPGSHPSTACARAHHSECGGSTSVDAERGNILPNDPTSRCSCTCHMVRNGAKTAGSRRYEIAKEVAEHGVYGRDGSGTDRLNVRGDEYDLDSPASANGTVTLEGAILDGMTARLLVQAYEALSPENQAKFDDVPLQRLIDMLWSKAKIGGRKTATPIQVCRHGRTIVDGCRECLAPEDWHVEDWPGLYPEWDQDAYEEGLLRRNQPPRTSAKTAGWPEGEGVYRTPVGEGWDSLVPGDRIRVGFEENARDGVFVRIEQNSNPGFYGATPVIIYTDEEGREQRYLPVGHESPRKRSSKTAGDNPFPPKKDAEQGPPDANSDQPAENSASSFDPTQMQPGQQVTINYTLTNGGGAGSCAATFESNQNGVFFFTYEKGRFGVTQQGGKYVDSQGTEFTFADASGGDEEAKPEGGDKPAEGDGGNPFAKGSARKEAEGYHSDDRCPKCGGKVVGYQDGARCRTCAWAGPWSETVLAKDATRKLAAGACVYCERPDSDTTTSVGDPCHTECAMAAEVKRSNTPGGVLGDPDPEGPGYHPATPYMDGQYD